MCGRFTLTTTKEIVAEVFGLTAARIGSIPPRYNIAPSQQILVVRNDAHGSRELAALRWGLIPSWAPDPAIGARMINARAETLAEKPSYGAALRQRRCLILADGFYEWAAAATGKQKRPFLFRREDNHPFAMAGLWERWQPRGDSATGAIESCTIITTAANELVRPIHARMPVIISQPDFDHWLDCQFHDLGYIESRLVGYQGKDMNATAVTTYVNTAANDDPNCIEPLDPERPLLS